MADTWSEEKLSQKATTVLKSVNWNRNFCAIFGKTENTNLRQISWIDFLTQFYLEFYKQQQNVFREWVLYFAKC